MDNILKIVDECKGAPALVAVAPASPEPEGELLTDDEARAVEEALANPRLATGSKTITIGDNPAPKPRPRQSRAKGSRKESKSKAAFSFIAAILGGQMGGQKSESPEAGTLGNQDNSQKKPNEGNFSHGVGGVNGAERYIHTVVSLLADSGAVVELRLLGGRAIASGYFDSFDLLARDAAQRDGRVTGLYTTVNTVNPALLARAHNRVLDGVKQTTSDTDILRRRWLPVDVDPVRPAGISSTNEEHDAASARAKEIADWLAALGFPPGILADSGNGGHYLIPIDLPNDLASTQLVKRCLEAIALRFTDTVAVVDLTMFNAARILRLYGTTAKKGDATPDRPHRVSRILSAPPAWSPVARGLLEALATYAPQEEPRGSARRSAPFNLTAWMNTHLPSACGPIPWKDGLKWILDVCPFNADHTNRSAVLIQFPSGAVCFRCHHHGCLGNNWAALRTLKEPAWRTQNSDASEKAYSQEEGEAHGGGGQPEPPRPLRRALPDPSPYPIEALGGLAGLAGGARQLHEIIQAPLALCGQSMLAATALAVQGHADIHIDGRVIPLSENFITVGESGERKSAVDKEALRPHRAYEKELVDRYGRETESYENDLAAYKKAREDALRKAKSRDEKRRALDAIGPAPLPPLLPVLATEEPTYEGLIKLLLYGHPSLGLFSDEGGRFIGGHGMSEEQQLKTAAGLSELWDGRRVSRVRGGDGAALLYGRRLSAHLMAQPGVAQKVLGNSQLVDQGLLSRCLVTWPTSTAGTRLYVEKNLRDDADLTEYNKRITEILKTPLPLAEGKRNELSPRILTLSREAKSLWIKFHDAVEKRLADNAEFSPIRGFANKAPEHALRLAGILTLYENLMATEVSGETVVAGIKLANHYLDEALRLFNASQIEEDIILGEKLLTWAQARHKHVSLVDIYQRGPNPISDAETARRIATLLTDHGWFLPVPNGATIDGTFRKEVWEVVK